ncbi:hypothetical protein KGA65_03040 [Ideonella sp. B7]|uniref:hypothetical protein n=1 Tax=Ideonella benzenivorans TaxID=2831643 RepID=UPI001CEDB8EE|nr:hypothetical protein [Ideonella benzenivorans]MCA6215512.1 hypothetical protein [Ideonella benzenivorans]
MALIHPLLGVLASRPEMLTEHAGAYAALASAELREAVRQWRRRLLVQVLAAALALAGLGLGGVAALLAAALPLASMPAPWALVAVPGALLLLAAGLAGWQARMVVTLDWTALQAQWALDQALWREAAQA